MTQYLETIEDVKKRTIQLDFLYIDLNTCTRCVGTDENLEVAIESVADVLAVTNTDLLVNKVLIETEEQAQTYQFVSSPTIRVNGQDIALEFRESQCDSCTDLCGCDDGTDCREWVYQDEVYQQAPVGMIVEAILSEIYAGASNPAAKSAYEVPQNLKNFFTSKDVQETAVSNSCCSETKQATCCEPSEKSDCCGSAHESGSCGCQ